MVSWVIKLFVGQFDGMGVVFGRWGGSCFWWGFVGITFYMAVFCIRGAPPTLVAGTFFLFLNALGIGLVGLLSQKEKIKDTKIMNFKCC